MADRKLREIFTYEGCITPLTPIHIGSGQELAPYNYVIKNNTFYRISLEKILSRLPLNQKREFIRLSENNSFFKIISYIKNIYRKEYGYLYSCEVEVDVINKYKTELDKVDKGNVSNKLAVFEFIGNYKGKYIPGSTIKGAIRGAYLGANLTSESFYEIKRKDNKTKAFQVVGYNQKSEPERVEKKILGLNEKSPFADPFKNLLVSDTEISDSIVEVRKVLRVNKKKSMPLGTHEVTKSLLASGESVELKFSMVIKKSDIDKNLLNKVLRDHRKGDNVIEEIKNLFIDKDKKGGLLYCLNKKAKKMLEEDKKFFRKIENREGIEACEQLESEMKNLGKNEALIRFGKGAGFNSTSLNLFNRNVEQVFTRTVVDGKPCGWAIISFKEKN